MQNGLPQSRLISWASCFIKQKEDVKQPCIDSKVEFEGVNGGRCILYVLQDVKVDRMKDGGNAGGLMLPPMFQKLLGQARTTACGEDTLQNAKEVWVWMD